MMSENQPLVVEQTEIGGFPCVRPRGEVDIASVPLLQEALARLLDGDQTRLMVDMQGLTYLDSTGLGCITAARRRAKDAGGDLVLVCTNARILRLLTITGLDQVFCVGRTADDALAALRGRSSGQ